VVNRFRLLLSVFVFCVVLLGGLALVRLFSWVSLSVLDRVFYVCGGFLFVFALCLSFFFSRLDVPESLPLPDLPYSVADSELVELRKELYKPVPVVGSPNGLVRDTSDFDVPFEASRLVDDVSMYGENRNILKPLVQDGSKKDDNEYSGVF
jgi:hypothetical protein